MPNHDRKELEKASRLIVGTLGGIIFGGLALLINSNKNHVNKNRDSIESNDEISDKKI